MEFALVFSVFFVVLYGVLTYSMIFLAQHSLNLAAEDGVRAALRWPMGGNTMAARADTALAVAQRRARWVGEMGNGVLAVAVCRRPAASGESAILLVSNAGACSGKSMADDQLEVVVRYDYGASPLVPTLPGMGLAIPAALTARATATLGNGMTTMDSGG